MVASGINAINKPVIPELTSFWPVEIRKNGNRLPIVPSSKNTPQANGSFGKRHPLAYMKSVRIIAAIKTLSETIAKGVKLCSETAVNMKDVPHKKISNSKKNQSFKVGVYLPVMSAIHLT
ncbi:hypothetical protein GCM10027340_18320 [Marinomonas epiphytica]